MSEEHPAMAGIRTYCVFKLSSQGVSEATLQFNVDRDHPQKEIFMEDHYVIMIIELCIDSST